MRGRGEPERDLTQPYGHSSPERRGDRGARSLARCADKVAIAGDHPLPVVLHQIHDGGIGDIGCVRPAHDKDELERARASSGARAWSTRARGAELMLLATGDGSGAGVQPFERVDEGILGGGIERAGGTDAIGERVAVGDGCGVYLVDEQLIILRGVGSTDALCDIGGGRLAGDALEQRIGASSRDTQQHQHDHQRHP